MKYIGRGGKDGGRGRVYGVFKMRQYRSLFKVMTTHNTPHPSSSAHPFLPAALLSPCSCSQPSAWPLVPAAQSCMRACVCGCECMCEGVCVCACVCMCACDCAVGGGGGGGGGGTVCHLFSLICCLILSSLCFSHFSFSSSWAVHREVKGQLYIMASLDFLHRLFLLAYSPLCITHTHAHLGEALLLLQLFLPEHPLPL